MPPAKQPLDNMAGDLGCNTWRVKFRMLTKSETGKVSNLEDEKQII